MESEDREKKSKSKLLMVEKQLLDKSNEIDQIFLNSDVEIGQLKM